MAAIEILKRHKLRNTNIRTTILDAFLQSKEALNSSDLESHFDYIDRITLYRTLKTFEDKGIIHQAKDGTNKVKYALCNHKCTEDHHHDYHAHFSCSKCHKTFCLDDVELPTIEIPNGFQLNEMDIILSGVCSNCN